MMSERSVGERSSNQGAVRESDQTVMSTSYLDYGPTLLQDTTIELWGKLPARADVANAMSAFGEEDNHLGSKMASENGAYLSTDSRRSRVSTERTAGDLGHKPSCNSTGTTGWSSNAAAGWSSNAEEEEEMEENDWIVKTHEGTPLAGLSNLTIDSVAVGGAHAVFVTRDGRAYSYGRNDRGQLGTGDTESRRPPVEVKLSTSDAFPPGFSEDSVDGNLNVRWKVVAAACGSKHTLLLAQLRTGGEPSQRILVAGAYEALGLGNNLFSNGARMLEPGGEASQIDRLHMHFIHDLVGVTAIAARGESSCCSAPRKDAPKAVNGDEAFAIYVWGEVCCWSCPSFFGAPKAIYSIPAPVRAVGLGGFFGLALDVNGDVYSWGDGTYGELGHASGPNDFADFDPQAEGVELPEPGKVDLQALPRHTGNVVSTSSSRAGSKRASDRTTASGSPQPTRLGRTPEPKPDSSVRSQAKSKESTNSRHPQVVGLACGERHSLLLDKDGRVYAFGENLAGQCGVPEAPGQGHVTGGTVTRPRLVPLEGPRKASGTYSGESTRPYEKGKAVFAGRRHSAVVTEDKRVYLWGHPSNRKLGHAGVNPDGTVAGEDPGKKRPPGVAVRSALRDAVRRPRLVCSLLHRRVAALGLGDECTFIVTGEGTIFNADDEDEQSPEGSPGNSRDAETVTLDVGHEPEALLATAAMPVELQSSGVSSKPGIQVIAV